MQGGARLRFSLAAQLEQRVDSPSPQCPPLRSTIHPVQFAGCLRELGHAVLLGTCFSHSRAQRMSALKLPAATGKSEDHWAQSFTRSLELHLAETKGDLGLRAPCTAPHRRTRSLLGEQVWVCPLLSVYIKHLLYVRHCATHFHMISWDCLAQLWTPASTGP